MTRTNSLIRKSAGVTLCLVGGVMVSYAAVRYATGMYRAQQARLEWEAGEASRQVAIARNTANRGVALEGVLPGAPVGRLVIPRIGLDEIVLEGVGSDELNAGPGHLPGSALPGMPGNAVISAHRDRHFDRLGDVQLGDTIGTESGQLHGMWVVVGRRIVGRGTPALFRTREPTLTLTTCWPIRYLGTAPDRLIISARLVTGSSPSARSRGGSPGRT